MGKYKSLISMAISAILIFIVPVLNQHGIIIDENTATTICAYILGTAAFIWTAWRNHNFTEAAKEGQKVIDEYKKPSKEEPEDDEIVESLLS